MHGLAAEAAATETQVQGAFAKGLKDMAGTLRMK